MTEAKTVRLGELAPDPVAVEGRGDRLTKIEDLLASLPTLGQLQSLNVRPWTGGDFGGRTPLYGVTAGNRRLAALCRLRDTGGTIKGVAVTDEFPVHVIFGEADDGVAFAGTVAENVQRVPETVVGEALAFAKMATTSTSKEIAKTFGVPEKRVRQRLAIAELHPDVLAMLDAGTLKLDAAEAFTVAEPEQQAAYLTASKGQNWKLEAYYIKREFADDLVEADSAIARLIGAEAYEAAGGKVMGAFDDAQYWISGTVIKRLLEAHWAREVEKWQAEGWSFAESVDQFVGEEHWKVHRCETLVPDGSTGKGKAKREVYSPEQMAASGVVYYPDASEAPVFGIKRYVEPTDNGRHSHQPVADLRYPGHDVSKLLAGAFNAAIAGRLSADRVMSLRLLVAALRTGQYEHCPLALTREYELPQEAATRDDADAEELQFVDALKGVATSSLDEMVDALVELIPPGINIVGRPDDTESALIELLGAVPEFDADGYFKALTKPYLDLAWDDMTDPSAGEKRPKGKAADLVAKIRQRAADTGWLPPQLRMPSYAGPHFVDLENADEAVELEEEVEDDLQAAE